ncbi:MAG: hypothetical protein LBU19_00620 [Treponema sp.]|jgi:hypothetical protein|nr:hypothetical protein [Treponema sp.]
MTKVIGLLLAVMAAVCVAGCAATESSRVVPQTIEEAPWEIPGDLFSRSFDDQYTSGYWVTRPSEGTIPVMGIAGRRRNRDDAIQTALADAARRAALYHGVDAESASVLNQGSGNLDYFADFDYRVTIHADPSAYIGSLVFDKDLDVYEKDGSVYVRAKYSGVADIPSYVSALEDQMPEWVKHYRADIPGFLTGVGAARNKGSPQATYQASYENAIISLLPGLSTQVTNTVFDTRDGKVQQNVTASQGTLTNVMILETWVDSKTSTVWTLLVAKERR